MATPPHPTFADCITVATARTAALVDGRDRRHSVIARRPVQYKIYEGPSFELPGPLTLAEIWFPVLNVGRDLRACGYDLADLAKPVGAPTLAGYIRLADELQDHIAALPEDHNAGRPYQDLRLFITEAQPTRVANYFMSVIKNLCKTAPAGPSPVRTQRVPMSDAERFEAACQRKRDRMTLAARYLLKLQELTASTWVVAPTALFEKYAEALESRGMRPLGRTWFFRVADATIGERTRRRIEKQPQAAYVIRGIEPMDTQERELRAMVAVDRVEQNFGLPA
ncbi:hypothetical protein [Streptomyces spiralis]|uniref:hypothetical protein n=1 Tax=Streptomyces spiralis TaxID=66376 RepID=UPI0036CE9F46